MRLPREAHTSRPWRIHEIAPDFAVEDVWALPTPGGPDDFPRLVALFADGPASGRSSRPGRALMAIRFKLGELLGLDDAASGLGARVASLRERLPADVPAAPAADSVGGLPFSPLYVLDDEAAAEIANRTMHGVLHLGWVASPDGGYRGQMAVLVKRNGRLGDAYMAVIKPFRYLIVYPAMLRDIERSWRAGDPPHRPMVRSVAS